MISIVEATCDEAKKLGLQNVALFGTRFTMQGAFYPKVFSRAGITLLTPLPDEQALLHDKYMNELVKGVFLDETRKRMLSIAERMKREEGIEGLILGGTELPLILRGSGDIANPGFSIPRKFTCAVLLRSCCHNLPSMLASGMLLICRGCDPQGSRGSTCGVFVPRALSCAGLSRWDAFLLDRDETPKYPALPVTRCRGYEPLKTQKETR